MHKLKERFFKDVESLNEGQLLTSTSNDALEADKVVTFTQKVPTGRGDIKGFAVSFAGIQANLEKITFDFSVNGKEVYTDMPASAFGIAQNDVGVWAVSTGASRIVKMAYVIPESAIIRVKVTTGTIGGGGFERVFVTGYFTKLFIPQQMYFNLEQHFQITAKAGTITSQDFILPTERGRIVGLSLLFNASVGVLNTLDMTADIFINGIAIFQNVTPTRYFATNNQLGTNNWIVNIQGGAVLTILFTNNDIIDLLFGVTAYFNEELGSKRDPELRHKQLPISSE